MKRSWIGFVLLIGLLLGGILVTGKMKRIHDPIEHQLQQAARYALDNEWDGAEKAFREAESNWEQQVHFRTCFADHNPVEEIDGNFELLAVFCDTRERITFAAGCRELARKVAAVGEAQELVWWNLL